MRFLILLSLLGAMYGADISKAQDEHDKAVSAADAKFVKYLVGVVKTAKDAEKVDLYKLINKYDPSNQEAAKFVAALGVTAESDLLGGDLKRITTAGAVQIVKSYNANKMDDTAWTSLPTTEMTVSSQKRLNTKVAMQKGEVYIICPSATDHWQGGAGAPPSTFKGLQDVPWLAMNWTVQDASGVTLDTGSMTEGVSQIVCKANGILFLHMGSPGPERIGSIRVKIFKVEK